MGVYDVSAVINCIMEVTGVPKIFYIGHSMGATEFFVAMSQFPHLNDCIATAFLYAPVAFLANTKSVGRYFAPALEEFYVIFKN